MSYEVKSIGKIGPELWRIFDEELGVAIEALEEHARTADRTHEARKHFKKIRAILRLVRERMAGAAYEAENVCFRDAGRRLRDLRDAQVLVNTLDSLGMRFFNKGRPALLVHAHKLLTADKRRRLRNLTEGGAIRDVMATLQAARARGQAWNPEGFGWKESRRAMKRSYKRGREAMRKALDDPGVENLHEWRKRVKYLWHHACLLRKTCPGFMKEFAHELEVLSEFLGDDHDLAVLREALKDRRRVLRRPRELDAFLKMLDIRRDEILRAAFDLGERLYAETPADFARALAEKRRDHRKSKRKTKELAPLLGGA